MNQLTLLALGFWVILINVESVAAEPASASHILVTVHQPDVSQLRRGGNPTARYARRSQYQLQSEVDLILNQLAQEYGLIRAKGWLMRSLGVYCEVFEPQATQTIKQTILNLQADPRVDSAQRLQTFHTRTADLHVASESRVSIRPMPDKLGYNDTYYELQHAFQRMDIERSHNLATGAGVRVAIIDSGVESGHPDLNEGIRSEDFTGQSDRSMGFHGTGLAGVIAARPNNEFGIVGVAPDVQLVDLRACWGDTSANRPAQCDTFSLARAIDRAITIDVDVINLSLAGPSDALLQRLLSKAHEEDIFLVAANRAGWENFPASLPFVLGVDAEALASGNVVAPGSEVMTTFPSAGFGYLSGSSLAAAHVAGVAALLVELAPQLAASELFALFQRQPQVNACALVTELNRELRC